MKKFFTVIFLTLFAMVATASGQVASREARHAARMRAEAQDNERPVLRRANGGLPPRAERNERQDSQQVQRELPPAEAPPRFHSLTDVRVFIGSRRVAVAPVEPVDESEVQTRYGLTAGWWGTYNPCVYGAGFGYGPILFGGYDFPVFASPYPKASMGYLLRVKVTAALNRLGVKALVPADRLQDHDREANTGKNAGLYGDHTQETARFIVKGTYEIVGEDADCSGFDGTSLGVIAYQVGWRLGNETMRDAAYAAGYILPHFRILRQYRNVTARLTLQFEDLATRDILHIAGGTGKAKTKEFSISEFAGFRKVGIGHSSASKLTDEMVAAVFAERPQTEADRDLLAAQQELASLETEAEVLEQRRKLEGKLQKARERLKKAQQKAGRP